MNTKLLLGGGVLAIILLLFFIVDLNDVAEAEGEGEGEGEGEVEQSADEIVAVPLSGTDETMEMNASNEKRFGVETSYSMPDDQGGFRDASVQEIAQLENTGVELTFNHVSPGEYSEVYGAVRGIPGETVVVELSGPGVMNTNKKEVVIGDDGYTKVIWRINQYGSYTATYVPYKMDYMKGSTTVEVN